MITSIMKAFKGVMVAEQGFENTGIGGSPEVIPCPTDSPFIEKRKQGDNPAQI